MSYYAVVYHGRSLSFSADCRRSHWQIYWQTRGREGMAGDSTLFSISNLFEFLPFHHKINELGRRSFGLFLRNAVFEGTAATPR